jgi:di/tricarboxylate transporter
MLTETITNNAAAIVLTPVAISMAGDLGVDARPLIFAVCFAASAAFMTPTGYQTNMMVYGPGSYRFRDFTRFGAPLDLLFWIVASFLIPWFFPFG